MRMTGRTALLVGSLMSICAATCAPVEVKASQDVLCEDTFVPKTLWEADSYNDCETLRGNKATVAPQGWKEEWTAELAQRMTEAYQNCAKDIPIQELMIPYSQEAMQYIRSIAISLVEENPDFFYAKDYVTSTFFREGEIVTLHLYYDSTYVRTDEEGNCSLIQEVYDSYMNAVNMVLSEVSPDMTQVEQLLAFYDYLLLHCEYDNENYLANTIPAQSFTAYGALVEKKAVCQGYALAIAEFCKRTGIENCVVSSDAMGHAWNMVKLDGEWYHLDVTWDDPVKDIVGRCHHKYFLKSDKEMMEMGYRDWVLYEKDGEVPKANISGAFANTIFRYNPDTSFRYANGYWYYQKDNKLCASLLDASNMVTDWETPKYEYRTLADGTIEILRYASKEKIIEIPDTIDGKTVSGIGRYAFRWSDNAEQITLPKSVRYIKSFAFADCKNLKEVTVLGEVTALEDACFDQCQALTKVVLPESLKKIEQNVFGRCTSLVKIVIPDHVTEISEKAFGGYTQKPILYGTQNSFAKTYAEKMQFEFRNIDTFETDAYTDVKQDAWYYGAISYVISNGIMNGKGDGKFEPNHDLTRAEFVTVLFNAEGKPDVETVVKVLGADGMPAISDETAEITKVFSDVKVGTWYECPISWAYTNQITKGYGTKFGVTDKITREQMVQMLYTYAKLKGMEITFDDAALEGFSDGKQISIWAVPCMKWAVSHGIMKGKGEMLDPQGYATRAECATLMQKILNGNQ